MCNAHVIRIGGSNHYPKSDSGPKRGVGCEIACERFLAHRDEVGGA